MQAPPKKLSMLLVPVFGLLFLGGSLFLRSMTEVRYTLGDNAPQAASASVNTSRRIILGQQLHFCQVCARELDATQTWKQRVDRIEMLRQAIAPVQSGSRRDGCFGIRQNKPTPAPVFPSISS